MFVVFLIYQYSTCCERIKNPSRRNLMKFTSGSRRENKRKEDRARAMAGLPRSKEEEKKRRDWQRRSGQNWGRPIFLVQEMKEAEVNPVPSKVFNLQGAFLYSSGGVNEARLPL